MTISSSSRPLGISQPEETFRAMDNTSLKLLSFKMNVLSCLGGRAFNAARIHTNQEYDTRVETIKTRVLSSVDQNLKALYDEFMQNVKAKVEKDTSFDFKFSNLFFRCQNLDNRFERHFHTPLFSSDIKTYFLNYLEKNEQTLDSNPENVELMKNWINRITTNTNLWHYLQGYENDYHQALVGNMFYKGYRQLS